MCGEGGHSGRDLPQRGLHPFKGVHCRGGLVVCAGVCVGGGGEGEGTLDQLTSICAGVLMCGSHAVAMWLCLLIVSRYKPTHTSYGCIVFV